MVIFMKKYILVVLSILLLTGSVFSVSFAWFTYVMRKSLATFTSNEILIELQANDALFIDHFMINDLAFIDFQNDLIDDQFELFDSLASSIIINIELSTESPLINHQIQIQNLNVQGLLFIVVYEGLDVSPDHEFESGYHVLLMNILNGYSTKEEMISALDAYNQSVLDVISNLLIYPGNVLTIQIAVWGDYDSLEDKEEYLNQLYQLDFSIASINARG